MNRQKLYFPILLPLLMWARVLSATAMAQTCTAFYQLEDATGYEPRPQHQTDSLNAAACRLRAALPQEFQSQFAVYDLGFYRHHTSYEGGIPDIMQEAIDGLSTSYYLIFGREIGEEGELKKVWVEMELPSTEDFCFWEDGTYSHLKFMVELRANAAKDYSGSINSAIFTARKEAMGYMESRVGQLVDCCGSTSREECGLCSWTTEEIREYFEEGGATFRDIEVSDSIPSINHDCVCDSEFDAYYSHQTGNDYLIENYTGITSFTLDSIQFQISELMDSLAWLGSIYEENGMSFYAVITDNSVFCGENQPPGALRGSDPSNIDIIMDNYRLHDIGILIHIMAEQAGGYSLVFQSKGVGGNVIVDLTTCTAFPQYCMKLTCVLDKLIKNKGSFFENTVINGFCKGNEFDLIFRLSDNIKDWGRTSTLSSVLESKCIVINLSNDAFFTQNEFCDKEKRGYLRLAETILHESVHAIFVREAAILKGPFSSVWGRRRSLNFLGYNLKFIKYFNHAIEEGSIPDPDIKENNSALIWTEHHYIFHHFFNDIVQDLYFFNDKYLNMKHYYYRIIWFDNDHWPPDYDEEKGTGYDAFTLWEYDALLKDKIEFPCCGN